MHYLKSVDLPENVQSDVRRYYQYLWWRHNGIPDEHILDDLNDHMRTQIMAHLNGHILRQVPVFANTPTGFIKDLVACCHSQLYVPVDTYM